MSPFLGPEPVLEAKQLAPISISISDRIAVLHGHAVRIEKALAAAGVKQPSLAVGTSLVLPLSHELEQHQKQLVAALDELRAVILGPVQHLFNLIFPLPATNATLHAIYHFKIAQNIGANEIVSYAVLAERCKLPEDDLRRYLRMAFSLHLFDEVAPGKVRHNAVSAILTASPQIHDLLGLLSEEMTPAGLKLAETISTYQASEEPSESACALTMNAPGKDYYTAISDDPEKVRRFAGGMSVCSQLPTWSVTHFAKHCGFDEATAGCPQKILDIGGSDGELCKALLESHPGIQEAISLDLPEVVAQASVPDQFKGRLKFGAYNFFNEQREMDADVVLFRNVFHNWPDKYAVQILRNQIPALRKGARVFVNEACLPDVEGKTAVQNKLAWSADLMMKLACNAKSRGRQDWHDLFAKADDRFKVVSIKTPSGSALAIIEVVWQG